MKYLTIAIPSYNVENYISDTLDSFIISDVLDDIEILVINDGSKDKTEEIAKKYEEKYPNSVRVITKENGGHGSAINYGIKEAQGLFFKVVDGDDWVEAEGLLQLVRVIQNTTCDMIINPFYKVNNVSGEKELVTYHEMNSYLEISFDDIEDKSDRYYMHSLTYRTSVLKENHIRIDEKLFYVDMEYNLMPIPHIDKVCFLPEPIYNYRIFTEHQSMSKENIINRRGQHKTVFKNLLIWYQGLEDVSDAKKKYILHNLAMMAMQQYKIILCQPISKAAKKELWEFDQELKMLSEEVYNACFGMNMWALRKFGKLFYPLFAKVVQRGELY